MEITLVCIGLIVLIFLFIKQKEEITKLRNGLAETFERLLHIQSLLEDIKKESPTATIEPNPEDTTAIPSTETQTPAYEEIHEEEAPYLEEETSLPPPLPVEPILAEAETAVENIETETVGTPVEPIERLSWFERFKRNNPDLEKFIGENLINKIGIVILVLGISFFVKYAIDKDWINEPARVGI